MEKEERDFAFNTNVMEEQDRANRQNYNIALGHALSQGRTSIGMEDIPLAVKVALSTAPQNRYRVFAEILKKDGSLTTTDIMDSLHVHRDTARKAMTELKAVEMVDESKMEIGSEHSSVIRLKDDFNWFLEPEFEAAQQDDYKRYREYLEKLDSAPTGRTETETELAESTEEQEK